MQEKLQRCELTQIWESFIRVGNLVVVVALGDSGRVRVSGRSGDAHFGRRPSVDRSASSQVRGRFRERSNELH